MLALRSTSGGAVAQLGARLDGIEEVVGSNPISSTNLPLQQIPEILNYHRAEASEPSGGNPAIMPREFLRDIS